MILVTAVPAVLAAQTVTGRVVDSASRRPLARVAVRLVPGADTARDTVFATAETAADGVFLLSAPLPGSYRVRVGEAHVGPPMTLATVDAIDAHEYVLGSVPAMPVAPSGSPPTASDSGDRVYIEKETSPHAHLLGLLRNRI